MNARLALHVLLTLVAAAVPGWLGIHDCRAGSIQNLLDNNNGMITVGNLTFTFTANSVSSDPANPPNGVTFTPPTTSTVDVTSIAGGLMFEFNPMLSLTTSQAFTQKISITYTVATTSTIGGAGLSFSGVAVDNDTKSEVMETFAGLNESLDVFTMKDGNGIVTGQNNQTTTIANPPMSLSVTDQGILTTPVRGNGATSTAQLYSINNTFTTPEPASITIAAIGAIFVLAALYRTRHLAAA